MFYVLYKLPIKGVGSKFCARTKRIHIILWSLTMPLAFRHGCRVLYSSIWRKVEVEYSIALCRVECQLAQQSSRTPIYFKVPWNLILANISCQHVHISTETSWYVVKIATPPTTNDDYNNEVSYYTSTSMWGCELCGKEKQWLIYFTCHHS